MSRIYKSVTLIKEDLQLFDKQAKLQKKNIALFPFGLMFLFFAAYAKSNGHMPPFYFYIILIPFIITVLYIPFKAGLFLGKVFFSIEILENNQIKFTTFGTLWRGEKIITVNLNDIKIEATPQPKLLYKKYALNNIYIANKKYYIFNSLLEESGLTKTDNKTVL